MHVCARTYIQNLTNIIFNELEDEPSQFFFFFKKNILEASLVMLQLLK